MSTAEGEPPFEEAEPRSECVAEGEWVLDTEPLGVAPSDRVGDLDGSTEALGTALALRLNEEVDI